MAAEVDAEGEVAGEGGGEDTAVGFRQLARIERIGIDLGTQDVVLRKGVAPLNTNMRGQHTFETGAIVFHGNGAVER